MSLLCWLKHAGHVSACHVSKAPVSCSECAAVCVDKGTARVTFTQCL